jgi:uncharacterized repeat protein (TIGR01451 family)
MKSNPESARCDVRRGGILLPALVLAGLCAGAAAEVAAKASTGASGFSGAYTLEKKDGASPAHRSKGILDGADITDQGIVLVAAGAAHQDTDSDGLLDAGESIEYHYTVLNLGPSVLSNLVLSDDFGPVTCPGTTLAPGANMVCTRTYAVTAGDASAEAVGNQVTITGQDPDLRPVQASDATLVRNLGGGAGLRVFKSPGVLLDADASNTVTQGDVLRYTFVVKNSNRETLGAVTLTEPDPTRIDTPITCDATTLGGAAYAGNGAGSLLANDIALCRADYTVAAPDIALGEVRNLVEAVAVAPIAGTIFATGTSLVVIPVVEVTLAKTLASGGPVAEAGEVLTYTLTFTATTSIGRSFAPGTVLETVPVGTQHITGGGFTCAAVAAGSSCSNTAEIVVPGNGSVSLSFSVLVLDPVAPGITTIFNEAQPATGMGCDPVARCDESTPVRNQADLSIVKTGPARIGRGDEVTFTIVVTNLGPDTAINARLEDPTPPGLVFVSTGGACSGPFPCALGNMALNETRTLTATYFVPSTYNGPRTIINTVTAFSDSDDPTPGDTSSSSTVIVTGLVPTFPVPAVIPVDAAWAQWLTILAMLALGGVALGRRR